MTPPRSTSVTRVAARVRLGDLVRDVVRLVVPLSCAGCGEPDAVVCARCLDALGTDVLRADLSAPRLARLPQRRRQAEGGRHSLDRSRDHLGDGRDTGVPAQGDGLVSRWPVLAGTTYLGSVRSVVGSWKDRGRTDCTAVLAERVGRAAHAALPVVEALRSAGVQVWVVPVPSTPSAVRRRGREPTTELARAALAVFAASSAGVRPGQAGAPVRLVRALGHRRRATLDQAGLGARDRASNLSGALRVRLRLRLRGRRRRGAVRPRVVCVLVDDVLTTGATLVECERALEEAGLRVVLGLVLSVAPGPGATVSAASQGGVVHSGRRSG